MDPYQAVRDYRADVQNVVEKAAEAKAGLQRINCTLSSPGGEVTVTVNAAGALSKCTFGAKADTMSKDALGALIVSTAQRAQAQAARQVTDVMAPLIGGDSDAMRFLKEQLPEPEVAEPEPQRQRPPADDDDMSSIFDRRRP